MLNRKGTEKKKKKKGGRREYRVRRVGGIIQSASLPARARNWRRNENEKRKKDAGREGRERERRPSKYWRGKNENNGLQSRETVPATVSDAHFSPHSLVVLGRFHDPPRRLQARVLLSPTVTRRLLHNTRSGASYRTLSHRYFPKSRRWI